MRAVILVSAVMLVAAAVLLLRRVEAGPSVLDRVVGVDVIVSTILAGLVLYSAWTGRIDFVPVMVVLSLVGFVGAVSLARFVAAESEEEARILTPQEVAEIEQLQEAIIDAADAQVSSEPEVDDLGSSASPGAAPVPEPASDGAGRAPEPGPEATPTAEADDGERGAP